MCPFFLNQTLRSKSQENQLKTGLSIYYEKSERQIKKIYKNK